MIKSLAIVAYITACVTIVIWPNSRQGLIAIGFVIGVGLAYMTR